jgi:hypothetical protein
MEQAASIHYAFSPDCRALIERLDLTGDEVIDAYRRRDDVLVVPSMPPHFYTIRWQDDGRALFVSSQFSRLEWQVDRLVPTELTFHTVLRLRRSLPAGPISRRMEMDRIWSRVADSFGAPVTCHDDFPACLRYTGRWDGKPPRVASSGLPDDRCHVDGVLEQSKENAKYVWALSWKKYEAWLPEPFGGIAADPDEAEVDVDAVPRLLFARMEPTRLVRPVVVRADIGELVTRLLCTRCSLRWIHDPPHFDPPLPCLHVFGAELLDPDSSVPPHLQGKEYIVPAWFVTDIRTGPAVIIAGEGNAQRSAVLPNGYKAGNRMSLRSIESLLAEMTPARTGQPASIAP